MSTKIRHNFLMGVLFMLLSSLGFTALYAMLKMLAPRLSFFSVIFLRFIAPLILLSLIMLVCRRVHATLHSDGKRLYFLRALFVTGAQLSIFYYLKHGTLFNATALLNTGPLFLPLISALFLKHRIGKIQIVALVIGFIGILLILQPNREIFSLLSLLGLTAGICLGASQTILGFRSQKEGADINLFYLLLFGTMITCVIVVIDSIIKGRVDLFHGWSLTVVFLVFGLAVTTLMNQLPRSQAYRVGGKPASLSAFMYMSVVFAALLDWFVFDEPPKLLSLIGTALVIIAGLIKIGWHFYIVRHHPPR